MYKKYTSPLGYQNNANGIDTYGVNHNGFTLRDELEYQDARQARENTIINNFNAQGITSNYPKQGTSFWGNNPENNYGFGTSNISANVELANNMSETSFGSPTLREDKKNIFNSIIEGFVRTTKPKQTNNGLINQVIAAANDLGENYINMINANHKSTPEMQDKQKTIDNYYHCIGNYDATKRGKAGEITANVIGLGRETADYLKNIFF